VLLTGGKFIVCYVTDGRGLPRAPGDTLETALVEHMARAAEAGADWIQIREKDLPGRTLLDLVRAARARVGHTDLLINDRLDVALAAGVKGVHLGTQSLPAALVRNWSRRAGWPDLCIGVSCHSVEEVRAAEQAGADYAIFGPVFETPSKAGFGPPQGLDRLREAAQAVRIPVLAIGGIDEERACLCRQAGAAGIAAIRLFQAPGDLRARLERVRALLEG
jgi:thiamine-phosphate pyrophosphorylase